MNRLVALSRGLLRGDASKYLVVVLFRRTSNLAVTIPVAHVYGEEFFGQLSLILILASVFSSIASLGLEVVAVRAVAEDNPPMLRAVASLTLVITPLASLLAAGLICFLPFDTVFTLQRNSLALVVLLAGVTPAGMTYASAVLRARGFANDFLLMVVVTTTTAITVKLWLLFTQRLTVNSWLYVELGSAVLAWHWALKLKPGLRRGMPAFREALNMGLPMLPHNLFHSLISNCDRFIIATLLGIGAAGTYSAAYQVPSVLGMALGEMNNAYIVTYAQANDRPALMNHIQGQLRVMAAVIAVASVLGPISNYLIFPASFASGTPIIPLLCLGFNGLALYLIAANLITMRGKSTRAMWVISLSSGAANIALNFLLVPLWGLWGAAAANTVTYALLGTLAAVIQRRMEKSVSWTRLMLSKAFLASIGLQMVVQIGWLSLG